MHTRCLQWNTSAYILDVKDRQEKTKIMHFSLAIAYISKLFKYNNERKWFTTRYFEYSIDGKDRREKIKIMHLVITCRFRSSGSSSGFRFRFQFRFQVQKDYPYLWENRQSMVGQCTQSRRLFPHFGIFPEFRCLHIQHKF